MAAPRPAPPPATNGAAAATGGRGPGFVTHFTPG